MTQLADKSITIQAETFGGFGDTPLLRFDMGQSTEQSKAAQTELNSSNLVPPPFDMTTLLEFTYSNPWLGAITNLLVDSIGNQWELVSRETEDDSDNQTTEDADYKLAMQWLGRGNVGRDGITTLNLSGLLKALAQTYDRTGNVFVEVLRNQAMTDVMQIVRLNPRFVQYEFEKKQAKLYQLDPYFGTARFIPFGSRLRDEETEFIHEREANDISSFYGIPNWFPAKESIEIDNQHRKYLKGFFSNHGTPRYFIHVTEDPDWQGIKPTDNDLSAVSSNVKNFLIANAGNMAGRNLIIKYPGGILVRAEALDHKLEDPALTKSSSVTRDEILAVRHIPLTMLGSGENANRSVSQEMTDNFIASVLEPLAKPLESIINKILHAPKPSGLGITSYDFKCKFERTDTLLQRIKALVDATGAPILTQDEARTLAGYEKVGSSELLVPANMVPTLNTPDE